MSTRPLTATAGSDGTRAFVRYAMRQALLDKDDEHTLAVAWKEHQDVRAMHRLVEAHTRLVIALAAKFRHYGLSQADLIQEGNLGLMQAIERFEPERGVRFSTYATWWIKSFMQDYILRNWSIVRTGTTSAQKSLFFNLRRLRSQIEGDTAAEFNAEGRANIAKTLHVNIRDVEQMEVRLTQPDQSLNAPLPGETEDVWQDFLADTRPSPEDIVEELRDTATRSRWLESALRGLTPREEKIIRARRLSDDEHGVTLEDLGRELGISKERVRQLEARALAKMKTAIEKEAGPPHLAA
jgi:RNA polymerase sigma-32 factor